MRTPCFFTANTLAALFSLAVATQDVSGQPLPRVADGWKIELIAAAPDIHAPTAVVESADGTIYLGQDPMDMNGPPTVPHDSVMRLEWRDGKMVKTLFADKLWAVMGLELIDETLYVVHSPFLSAFRDTDGDGRADSRIDLVTGLGPKLPAFSGYNDHVPSGIRLGMDGFLYVSIGDKGIPKAVGRDGRTISMRGGGVIRVRPDGTDLEIFSTGLRNPLSVALTSYDEVFTYGNDDDSKKLPNSLIHNIDGGHYGYPYEFLDRSHLCLPIVGGEMGGAGTQGFCFNESGLAAKFRGNLFFCDFGRQTLDRFEVESSGGTFRLQRRTNIVSAGKLNSFRPFAAAVGGDGDSILITDWTLPGQLVTGATSAGRLFRLTYHDDDAVRPKSHGDDTNELKTQLASLGNDSQRVRMKAQRLLASSSTKSVDALIEILVDTNRSPTGLIKRLHALWTLDAIGGDQADAAVISAIGDGDPLLRAQAIRATGIHRRKSTISIVMIHLSDEHPAVRREAAIALGRIGMNEAVEPLLAAVGDSDRFTAWSIRQALHRIGYWNSKQLTSAVLNSKGERQRQLLVLMENVWNVEVVKAWSRIANEESSQPPEFDLPLRQTAYRMLANLYHKYPQWKGFWFGPNPLAGRFPKRTQRWSDEAEQLILTALSTGLAVESVEDRLAAVAALAAIGPKAASSLVTQLNRERNANLRHAILMALKKTGTVGISEVLGRISDNENERSDIRRAATVVLTQDRSAASTAELTKIVANADVALLALSLPELARRNSLNESELLRFIQSNDTDKQIAALNAIACSMVTSGSIEERVVVLLGHDDPSVQLAAIKAATTHRYRLATDRLIQLHDDSRFRFDVEAALLEIPNSRALDIYLAGLASTNSAHRQSCTRALMAIRDEVSAKLTAIVKQGNVSPSVLPLLRRVLTNFEIVDGWQVIGPFPRQVPDSLYRTDPDFSQMMSGAAGQSVTWKPHKTDIETGTLELNGYRSGAADNTDGFGYENTGTNYVSLFAHAVIESTTDRDALLLVGSSGSLDLRLNGKRVYRFSDLSGRPFVADDAIVRVRLSKGRNIILARSYSGIGHWRFAVRVSSAGQALLAALPTKIASKRMRSFALENAGDAKRGEVLFFDQKRVSCAKCHAVAGEGGRIGPDLAEFAIKYDREETIRSILDPSQRLATGYSSVLIATEAGQVFTGLIKSETSAILELVDSEGKIVRISKDEIDQRRVSQTSIMPNGLAATITKEQFTDMVEYLMTLKSVPHEKEKSHD